jgi:hypothetical protein
MSGLTGTRAITNENHEKGGGQVKENDAEFPLVLALIQQLS